MLLMSPKQVAEVIYNELQIVQEGSKTSMTASKKQMSTSEKVLKSLGEKHPFPNIVREYRHIQKHLSNWIDSLEKFVDDVSGLLCYLVAHCPQNVELGRIHTHWMQTNTATGRVASMAPNLQNLPKNALFLTLDDDEDHGEGSGWADDEENENKQIEGGQSNVHVNFRNAFCSKPGYE